MPDQMSGLLSPFLRRRRIAAALPLLAAGRVLDFGCGTGELARWLAAERYLGVDRDRESVEIARRRFPDHDFQTVDAFAAGHAAGAEPPPAFDLVVALAVIEHLPDPVGWLAGLCPLLAADARVVVTTPHPRGRGLHDFGARFGIFSREGPEEHETFLDRPLMAEIAQSAGFRLTLERRFLLGLNQLFVLEPAGDR